MDFSYTSHALQPFLDRLRHEPAVVVHVVRTQGSVPREAGAWMGVFADGQVGTVGGGHLEFDALAQSRAMLLSATAQQPEAPKRVALGPSLGQCCGGVVYLRFEPVTAADIAALTQRLLPPRQPVALFGGGHVGHALARALAPLPFAITWIDSRDGVLPANLSPFMNAEHSDPVHAAVPSLPAGSRVLVMSFSHAEDLDIVAACLQRQRDHGDLPFIGLIGSRTKWASFRSRLSARGFTEAELAHVTCPIGLPGITGKEPEVIAVAVAAQLLQHVYANARPAVAVNSMDDSSGVSAHGPLN